MSCSSNSCSTAPFNGYANQLSSLINNPNNYNYNRISTTIPRFAQGYNYPVKPQPYRPPCAAFRNAPVGSIYTEGPGVYGKCSGGALPGSQGYDFVCGFGKNCYSQTSPLVGDSPDAICCQQNGYSSGATQGQLSAGTSQLNNVKFWTPPGQWTALAGAETPCGEYDIPYGKIGSVWNQ